MKKFSEIACCVALIFVYVIAYAGVGVHHCHSDHTSFIRLLAGDLSCEAVHSHDDGNSHHHHHHHHEVPCGGHCDGTHLHSACCCDTSIYVITASQDTEDGDSTASPERHLICQVMADSNAPIKQISFNHYRCTARHSQDRPLQAQLSVWRL